jgi:hypothetical protein
MPMISGHVTLISAVGLVVAAFQVLPSARGQPPPDQLYQILRVTIDDQSELDALMALDATNPDIKIWSDGVAFGTIDVRVSPEHQPALDAAGLRYEVYIEDLSAHVERVFSQSVGEGFFDAHRTYDEHVAFMNDLVATYPDIAEMVDLGPSVEGRPLWAMRITGPGTDKPGVMYHGSQHGNERTGTVVVAFMAEYLLTQYAADPHTQRLVDNVEWFLLPIMNPDGYVRGNRYNVNDVDLNRNWDGPDPYPDPFSEPETAALRDFFIAHPNVHGYIDFHTYGEMILWPWAYKDGLCEDHETFHMVALDMADRIALLRGTRYDRLGPVYTTIYPVRGGSVDYVYGELGLWALTFELGSSYSVPVLEILPTATEIAPTMVALAEWVNDCNGNDVLDWMEIDSGDAEDCNSNRTPDACEMQGDFDGDAVIDVCDADIDDDGIPNDGDVCDFTPNTTPINSDGSPVMDATGDCDVDLSDHLRFLGCLARSGPGVRPSLEPCLTYFDHDDNGQVDLTDFGAFSIAFTGAR